MAKQLGKVTIKLDGQTLPKKQSATFNPGGTKRNTVKGNDIYGYSEEAMEATVDIDQFIGSATDLDAINAASDVTLLVSLDTGQQYVLAHAWLESPPDVTEATDGGSTKLKFVAISSEKVS